MQHPAMPKPIQPAVETKVPPKPPLARSHTDSNIQYPVQDTPEIAGTSNLVTREGHINLKVLLKVRITLKFSQFKLFFLFFL